QCGLESEVVRGDAHAAAAAAGDGFDQHRKSDGVRELDGFFFAADDAVAARDDRNLGGAGQFASGVFIPELGHGLRGRADEIDVAAAADFVEVSVFGEEAVAGMDGLDVAHFGGADHAGDFEVAIGGLGGTDAESFVGELQVLRAAVAFAVDG